MTIIITNISDYRGGTYQKGPQTYQVRINQKVISEFKTSEFIPVNAKHSGLAFVLEQAAKSVQDPNRIEKQQEDEFLAAITNELQQLRKKS